jgi:hypothetical protein
MKKNSSRICGERTERSGLVLRGHRVMLDADVAHLYGVDPAELEQAVKRNVERFPADFMFQLTGQEYEDLRSRNEISDRGGRRRLPCAFTKQGVAMLSTVLNSKEAIRTTVEIMRTFIYLRRMVVSYDALAGKIAVLEKRYDALFKTAFESIRQLMKLPPRIGFDVKETEKN